MKSIAKLWPLVLMDIELTNTHTGLVTSSESPVLKLLFLTQIMHGLSKLATESAHVLITAIESNARKI